MKIVYSSLRLARIIAAALLISTASLAGEFVPCEAPVAVRGADRVLMIQNADGTTSIRLQTNETIRNPATDAMDNSVWRICQTPRGSLLFLRQDPHTTLYDVFRVERENALVVDQFWGYSPSLSPDGRWIIMRRMYPVQSAGATDDYLIYDMAANASQNRRTQMSRDDPKTAGILVYPMVDDAESRDNTNVSEQEIHSFQSDRFYWASDSTSVAFGDFQNGRLSIVLIRVNENPPRAYTFTNPRLPNDDCLARLSNLGRDMSLVNLQISDLPRNSLTIVAELRTRTANQNLCGTKFVSAPFSEFESAKREPRFIRPRRPSIRDPRE
jgi:hypothetical protein